MPWSEASLVDQRYQVVQWVASGLWTVSEAAAHAGIARKTLYKWWARYDAEGVAGLGDRSRAPHTRPQQVAAEQLEALVALRRRYPRWGARKLRRIAAERAPEQRWPAPSTIHRALQAAGLVTPPRRRTRHATPWRPAGPADTPNALWTVDFKGEFRLGDRRLCYPLTVVDHASRYLLLCQGLPAPTQQRTQAAFAGLFRERGLPAGILSDNGGPFASTGLARLSRLSVWWLKLGIGLYRSRPGCPQDNPRHERMHRELKAETARPPAASMGAQQRRFRAFVGEYNELRPHESLDQLPPARLYEASERSYPERIRPWDYAGHLEVRKVDCLGRISWHDRPVRVGKALAAEHVGLEEIDDGIWALFFRNWRLGVFDERQMQISG